METNTTCYSTTTPRRQYWLDGACASQQVDKTNGQSAAHDEPVTLHPNVLLVSVATFYRIDGKDSPRNIGLKAVLDDIKAGTWKPLADRARTALTSGNPQDYDAIKRSQAAITAFSHTAWHPFVAAAVSVDSGM